MSNYELPNDVAEVISIVRTKYDMARHKDYIFDYDKYLWLLGVNTLKKLQACFDLYITFDGKDSTAKMLMGIPIEVDTKNPDGLRLFKEV